MIEEHQLDKLGTKKDVKLLYIIDQQSCTKKQKTKKVEVLTWF
jgi:hypothetical protein